MALIIALLDFFWTLKFAQYRFDRLFIASCNQNYRTKSYRHRYRIIATVEDTYKSTHDAFA